MLEEITHNNFFCSNCQFNIEDEKQYKSHYKSDFHRYNIKRKLLNLQPATYEQYLKRKNSKKNYFTRISFSYLQVTAEKVEKVDDSEYKCIICK
jgi:hypothetical protein